MTSGPTTGPTTSLSDNRLLLMLIIPIHHKPTRLLQVETVTHVLISTLLGYQGTSDTCFSPPAN